MKNDTQSIPLQSINKKNNSVKNDNPCSNGSPSLIYIEWCDAITNDVTWLMENEIIDWADNPDWVIQQVGFLIKETKEYILLASRRNPHSVTEKVVRFDGIIKIPKTWVRKRIDLTNSIS